MTSLQRRRVEEMSPFARLDRMFDEWFRTLPMRRPPMGTLADFTAEEIIRVDEYRDGDTQVIRAELPGIDPEQDVEVTVHDGMLHIAAERKIEQDSQDKGYTRHEMRYGSFARSLPMPEGATESDIHASYKDGILEIRIPVAEPAVVKPTRVPVSKG